MNDDYQRLLTKIDTYFSARLIKDGEIHPAPLEILIEAEGSGKVKVTGRESTGNTSKGFRPTNVWTGRSSAQERVGAFTTRLEYGLQQPAIYAPASQTGLVTVTLDTDMDRIRAAFVDYVSEHGSLTRDDLMHVTHVHPAILNRAASQGESRNRIFTQSELMDICRVSSENGYQLAQAQSFESTLIKVYRRVLQELGPPG